MKESKGVTHLNSLFQENPQVVFEKIILLLEERGIQYVNNRSFCLKCEDTNKISF